MCSFLYVELFFSRDVSFCFVQSAEAARAFHEADREAVAKHSAQVAQWEAEALMPDADSPEGKAAHMRAVLAKLDELKAVQDMDAFLHEFSTLLWAPASVFFSTTPFRCLFVAYVCVVALIVASYACVCHRLWCFSRHGCERAELPCACGSSGAGG
jgi:hypothetical protein